MVDTSGSLRRKMNNLVEDLKETRDQGKRALEDSSQVPLFKGMYLSLSAAYERFESLYDDICDTIDDKGDSICTSADHALRGRAKRYFHESNAHWSLLSEQSSRQTAIAPTFSWGTGRSKTKLPTLELPKFSGDRTKWPRFKDTFISLVKDDPDLSDIDRFHYLLRSLEGNASSIIAHVPVTDDNFRNAWDALMEAYDNKRLLATAYLEQLLNLKPLSQKPSAEVLSRTVAQLAETVAAFRMLDIPNQADFMFFHIARRCLDASTREEFELSNNETFPSFEVLIKYLRSRCTATELASGLSHVTSASQVTKQRRPRPFWPPKKTSFNSTALLGSVHCSGHTTLNSSNLDTSLISSSVPKCYACKESHLVAKCPKFLAADLSERLNFVRNWRGCRNCLNPGHNVPTCRSKFKCQVCRGKHHTLLHSTAQSSPTTPVASGSSQFQPPVTSTDRSAVLNSTSTNQLDVMLGTAVGHIEDRQGEYHPIRLVIDSGSHFSFITRDLADRLGLAVENHSLGIWGIGETPLEGFKGRAQCSITPVLSKQFRLQTKAIVLDKITSPLPGFTTSSTFWKSYVSYPLADSEFWRTRPVDFLLGCDLFPDILTGELITISNLMPRLLGTIFGYVVLGRVCEISCTTSTRSLHVVPATPNEVLHSELRRFWELEEIANVTVLNPDDEQCEEQFRSTHYRLPDGRFVVRLPFRTSNPSFSGTRGMAIRRMEHLEHKLERNSDLRSKYREFMNEYHTLGHMEIASRPGRCLIPHHCVVKGEGENLKLRVVFDAAAKTTSGSLNEHLLVGPKLQTNIVDVHLNFRLHKFVFTADVIKMYRQILVHPADRLYQHILWRFHPAEAMSEYELTTVTYGTSCAPYLALRTLQQLVEDDGGDFPLAAAVLPTDTYIDDLATGADTLEATLELLRQVVGLMARGRFSLSKWAANHPEILSVCRLADPTSTRPPDEGVILDPTTMETNSLKILGLKWDPKNDSFSYEITIPRDLCTKRTVLSSVAKIYDPLGFVGPVVVVAKGLIQEAWKRGLNWDEEFPLDMRDTWYRFVEQLHHLSELHVPRWIVPESNRITILIFCDASEKAYCAAAYLRSESSSHCQVHLLLAKTKLAPVKFTTIPRLELCAALLAAQLWQSLQPFCQRLKSEIAVHFFSDSMVVLSWLRTPYHQLKTFVANRVVQIRELTSAGEWKHVSSGDNPSDVGSRGSSVIELLTNILWFEGPSWAKSDPSKWPVSFVSPLTKIPELKLVDPGIALLATTEEPYLITCMSRFSKLSKLLHTFAYVLRFIACLRGGQRPLPLKLSLSELKTATLTVVKLVQREAFFKNRIPTQDTPIPNNLISLSPFLHESGVLMVGGRLRHSDMPWGTKHPMLLPAKTHLADLILDYYHRALLHPGPTLLLSVLRSKYWLLGARHAVRQFNSKCVSCRKLSASPHQPPMGDLPKSRFREGRAFLHVGVDFAGPFLVTESLRRKAPTSKAYLCLMVCLSTKALHLEVVSSLSTPAFLAAFDRFIGRRGLPEKMFSDNGTNFVGAAKYMSEFYKWYRQQDIREAISTYALDKEIEWSFIPPHAPFFGGLWEAGVKAVKRLMRSIYGQNTMSLEEFNTWLIKIEAILNSRPLCPLSSDPNELDYLSPGHFLIGSPLLAHPEPSYLDTAENRLSRWQLISQKAQHFWQRWRREYLTTLQERVKWRRPSSNLLIGDLVILMEDQVPRLQWPIGRVQQVFPGKDNVVRVATVQTATSTLKRPVNKLVPLLLPPPSTESPSNS